MKFPLTSVERSLDVHSSWTIKIFIKESVNCIYFSQYARCIQMNKFYFKIFSVSNTLGSNRLRNYFLINSQNSCCLTIRLYDLWNHRFHVDVFKNLTLKTSLPNANINVFFFTHCQSKLHHESYTGYCRFRESTGQSGKL